MPLDAYNFCPCGSGKKIKFCCNDLLGELQKIDRMIEGEQYLGCLRHIEQLERKRADRACLMAIKGMLLRATGQMEAAAGHAAAFVEKHPENATALAESAIVTAAAEPRDAMVMLQRALAVADGNIDRRLCEAMVVVAGGLAHAGEWLAGRALMQLLVMTDPGDSHAMALLSRMNRSQEVPLLLKDGVRLTPCPEDAPWKDRFDKAAAPAGKGNWQAAAERFETLAKEEPEAPAIWRNLATLRGWLADTPGCIAALRRYATLTVPLEDAVEATGTAMILSDDPLGDLQETFSLQWEVGDIEEFQAAVTLDARAMVVPTGPAVSEDDDEPPPKSVYGLFDRPMPEAAEHVTLHDTPRFLGQMMLYGRQTDRQARLEVVDLSAEDLAATKALLREIAGRALAAEPTELVEGKISASFELIQGRMALPQGTSQERRDALAAEYLRDALMKRWPDLNLGLFDGKSPREAAGQEDRRVDLLAAVAVLQTWCEDAPNGFDFNTLRAEFGLPVLEQIDPEPETARTLPLVRLSRVTVERLSDEDLILCYHRAAVFDATDALRKFARAVVDRPSLVGREEQIRAYGVLARLEDNPDRALDYLHQGRAAASAAGQSPAPFLLSELAHRFARGETDDVNRLIREIQTRHIEEPGVAGALTQLLISVGVLRPDGTPIEAPPPRPEAAAVGEAAEEPGRLWTPDSEPSGGGGKIWTPE